MIQNKICKICFAIVFYLIFLLIAIFFIELKLLNFLLVLFQIFLFFIIALRYKSYIKKVIFSTDNNFDDKKKSIDSSPLPVVVITKNGKVLYCNNLFTQKLNLKNIIGKSIFEFINEKKMEEIIQYKEININYNGQKYIIFSKKMDANIVLYFFEDTYCKITSNKYKVAVCIATFDNKNEMIRNNIDFSELQIIAELEKKLQKFASHGSGFSKKIGSNFYLLFIDENFLKKCIAEKFEILQLVKEIKNPEEIEATISMGIGRNGKTLKEAEFWAREALEMALGRGGDQIVIKSGGSFSFFGGTSKGIQNRNKVKTRVIAGVLSKAIKKCDKAIIMGHKFSDIDSVGACIGMYNIIKKIHKRNATIFVNEKQSLALKLIKSFKENDENMFAYSEDIIDSITNETLLIVVDTHNPTLLESNKLYEACEKVIVIDHHRLGENRIKNALIFYHEPYASSTCEMIAELISYLGENFLTKKEAEALLAGIMLDTKNFITKTSVRVFEAAAFLKRKNADTIKSRRFFIVSADAYKEKCKIASRAEFLGNFAIACTGSFFSDIRIISAQVADELLEVDGVKASFVFYSYENGVGISARSLGEINVQIIMEDLGGGGHYGTAGAYIQNTSIDQVKEKLIKKIKVLLRKL